MSQQQQFYLLELGGIFVLQETIAKVLGFFFIQGGEIFLIHSQLCLGESQVKHHSLPEAGGTFLLALKPMGGLHLHIYQCHFDTERAEYKYLHFTTYFFSVFNRCAVISMLF